MSQIDSQVPRADTPATACVVCGAVASDGARAGWHVFDDGDGEEHALCAACVKAAPLGRRNA